MADFNHDNYQDMVVANTATNTIGIRFGYGNGTFGDQILYSTGKGSQPYWVAASDFNNDNQLDIAVANYGTNNIAIFLADKNGKFSSSKTFSLDSSRPISFAIGHLNKDNQWDIALITDSTFYLTILYGKGDGSFQMGISYFLGFDSIPSSILINDFNRDKQSDIVVLNYGTSEFVLFLSNNNTFIVNKYSTEVNGHPSSMTVDYFNSDNYFDIAVVNSATRNLVVFYGNGYGQFQLMPSYSPIEDSYLRFIVSGQFTNDLICDLAIIDSNQNSLIIYKGNENGVFSKLSQQSTDSGSIPYSIVVTDFNNDNQSDVIIVNNGNNDILLFSFYSFQSTAEQNTYSSGPGSDPQIISVVDMNNDTNLDILVANTFERTLGLFIGLGNGTFKDQVNIIQAEGLDSFVTADFNKDQKLDIAVLVSMYGKIFIYFADGNDSFQFGSFIQVKSGSNPVWIIVADFNTDNNPDIATANHDVNNIGVFLGNNDGTSFQETYYNLADNDMSPIFITTADLNKDGFDDLILANEKSPTLSILLGTIDGNFPNPISIDLGSFSSASWIVIGDMNNDGQEDIIVSSRSNNIVGVLLGNGQGSFSELYSYIANEDSLLYGHALGYFNKDNVLDIAAADLINSGVMIFLRNSTQNLIQRNMISIENEYPPQCIATGDFNKDGETDIVVGISFYDVITVFLLKYQAVFANKKTYDQGSGKHPNSITAGDFNNDQQMDLVIANSGGDNIEILMDYQNGEFRNQINYPTGENSHPRYIVTGHFDRNNQLDIALVNYGENNLMIILNPANKNFNKSFQYSTGAESSPNSLAVDDVNNDGWSDVIVTNSKTDNLGIFLGFDYTTLVMNQPIGFDRGLAPQDITVADFNEDSIWDLAIACEGIGNVTILLGNSDGTFMNKSSYNVGVEFNRIKIVIGYFNNDSQLDLAAFSFGFRSLVILLGAGDGTFPQRLEYDIGFYTPVFIVPADFNHDGKQDFVAAYKMADNIGVFFGNENGRLSEQVLYSVPALSGPIWIAVGDLNNDNISDLVVANTDGGTIGLYFGVFNGTFNNLTIYSTGEKSAPSSIAIGDFDKDNSPDIAVLNIGTKTIAIFYGYGNGTFPSPIFYQMKRNSLLTTMIVEDLNNDTILDIAVTNFVDGYAHIVVFYGLGKRRFLPAKMYSTEYPAEATWMTVKDLNKDGKMDFIISISKKDKVIIMITDKSEPLGPLVTLSTGTGSKPSAIAISHLNNDNQLDIVVVNSGKNEIVILLGDGNGYFVQGKIYSTGVDTLPNSIVIEDMDGDQQNDLILTNSNKGEIAILFSYGNGTFAPLRTYETGYGSEPSSVSVADLNKDNLMDIVVANAAINTVVIFYGAGNKKFNKGETYSFKYDYRPKSIVIADMNNDTWLDIGVANFQSGVVNVLFHTCELGKVIV